MRHWDSHQYEPQKRLITPWYFCLLYLVKSRKRITLIRFDSFNVFCKWAVFPLRQTDKQTDTNNIWCRNRSTFVSSYIIHIVFSISFLKITISINPIVVFVLARDSIYKSFSSVFENEQGECYFYCINDIILIVLNLWHKLVVSLVVHQIFTCSFSSMLVNSYWLIQLTSF